MNPTPTWMYLRRRNLRISFSFPAKVDVNTLVARSDLTRIGNEMERQALIIVVITVASPILTEESGGALRDARRESFEGNDELNYMVLEEGTCVNQRCNIDIITVGRDERICSSTIKK